MLKMLDQITGSETDTFDEVNKFLNILREKYNDLVDLVEANATRNDAYNTEVEKFNEEIMKGGK